MDTLDRSEWGDLEDDGGTQAQQAAALIASGGGSAFEVVEAARARQSRYRAKKRREQAIARGLDPDRLVGRPPTVWTPEMRAALHVLWEAGHKPPQIFRAGHFPGVSIKQIKGKCQYFKESQDSKPGSHQALGLQVGVAGPPPDPAQIAERDERVNAEVEADLWNVPNHRILGDPSPQRLAVARALDRDGRARSSQVRICGVIGDPPPFSISAVRKPGAGARPEDHNFMASRRFKKETVHAE